MHQIHSENINKQAHLYYNVLILVCNQGLGIEYGASLPPFVLLSASSSKPGYEAIEGRLSGPSCWCANTNAASEYIQLNFGAIVTITGIAVQGSPTTQSWVNDFYMDYGLTVSSITTYTEKGVSKVAEIKCRPNVYVDF